MDHIDKKIISTLQSLKSDKDFGADLDVDGIHRRAMSRCGFDPDVTAQYTWRDYLETYLWQLTHSMLKPLASAVAVFVFAVIGSVSVVSASTQALPGERLYPIKISIEKTQLALAFTSEQRSSLRVEFASRRLEEMVQVAALMSNTESESVRLAADRFKNEVANIQEELHIEDTSEGQQEFAKVVGRKVDVYSSTVASTGSDLPDQVLGEVEDLLEETKDQVVEVIITAHEAYQDDESAKELDQELAQQIEVIEKQYGEASYETVAIAEALRAEGLYRRAFQVLKEFTYQAQADAEISDEEPIIETEVIENSTQTIEEPQL